MTWRVQLQIILKVITGWRPNTPDGAPPTFVAIMTDCWNADAAARPDFTEILPRLKNLYKEIRMAAHARMHA